MLRVGLTGGIGAGKSTVAGRLAEHGAVIIDSDKLAREVVEPGTEGLAEIVAAFGAEVLSEDGSLNRPALAAKAFADDESRKRLNAIVHPRVGARTAELMTGAAPDAIVVHDIPLLVENGFAPNYHLVIVVDAPVETRVRRLIESRGMPESDARARIAAQATPEQRRAAADVWLDNGGASDIVLADVDALWADRLVPFEANVRLHRAREADSPKTVPYDETWPAQAARAIARLKLAAGEKLLKAEHVGPTSVPGRSAPDVIDLELTLSTVDDQVTKAFADAGFPRAENGVHLSADPGRPVRVQVF
ncbi:dephospho-CoA kinase [Amycolatopsis xylanica]|uniref:Dephospho-CoA kinase n=1 Tax=Amycolatopsis xylanica TaxID=589385 RepID=A0A1H3S2U4_9PSEU|nr:dephospho-CoA kinase [Amycolatopsis xylanica]